MGNRAQIVCNGVWMYTHWDGIRGCEGAVLRAIKRSPGRWNDPCYFTRIIFEELTRNSTDDTLGYGLSTQSHDTGGPLIVVDMKGQQFWLSYDEDTLAPKIDSVVNNFEDAHHCRGES